VGQEQTRKLKTGKPTSEAFSFNQSIYLDLGISL
jgi:hypothetical protein